MKNINNNLIFALGILGVVALNVLFISPTTTNAYTAKGSYPANAAYTYCDGCGGVSNTNTTNNNSSIANPVLYSLNPTNTTVNSNTRTVTLLGTGFRPDSIARWNSFDRPTSYINSRKLIMELNDTDIKTPGQYLVTVVNPSPDGGKFSNAKVFTVNKSAGTVAGATTKNTPKKVYISNTTVKTVGAELDTDSSLNTTTGSTDSDSSNLSANVSSSSNNFMPSTILGWLILFALILASVALFRKLWVTEADKNKPLKHA